MVRPSAIAISSSLFAAASAVAGPQSVFTANGTAQDIQPTLDAFRSSLGALNANLPQSFDGGRREINWDGVPDTLSSPNAFPGDFFNAATAGRARGITFNTDGSHFEVSADNDNPTNTPRDFAHIDASYLDQFEAFSPQRLFAPIGSTRTEVAFFLPGTQERALVKGFGAIFSDIDVLHSTSVEFYDRDGGLLGTVLPSVSGPASGGFSFAGGIFDDAVVWRVVLNTGTLALGPENVDNPQDLLDVVVMDDFIYGEPVAVPAPGAIVLAGFGLLLGATRRGTRR